MEQVTESSGFRPDKLDVRRFARAQASLKGQIKLSDFVRLREEAYGLDEARMQSVMVEWQAQGIWHELKGGAAQTRIQLQASLLMPLQCQRCLEAVQESLLVDRQFLFVADEATAMKLDDESEEDVLVASKTFDLLELIEDELIMGLPIVPRHEQCASEMPHVFEVSPDPQGEFESGQDELSGKKASPFAVLQRMKKQ